MNATFAKKTALRKHMFEVHEAGYFVCEKHCGRRFKSAKFLNMHLERIA